MTEPFSIVIITGSPTRPSRTLGLVQTVEQRLLREAFRVRTIHVRDLPAEALLHAKFEDPAIKEALSVVEQADGVIVASPVYKAAYTGVLKAFLDLFPQFGLRGKVVLPLLTGGTIAHVLALDYALRPVLQSLDPRLTVGGLFVLDKAITLNDDGVKLDPEVAPRLEQITQTFIDGLRAHH
ncbi:MAG: NADPH-dependent FMN reductase [Polyangiales bacterium]